MIKLTENQREILQALLDGKDIEVMSSTGDFYEIDTVSQFFTSSYFGHALRVKPRTIVVNGVEVPEPIKVKPACGTMFYTAAPNPGLSFKWFDDGCDNEYFNAGICHSTPVAAALHWEAMIKPSRVN